MSVAALRLGGGARAVEELLLEDLDALLPQGVEALRRPPVRLVLPSRALRLHLQSRLAARHGAVLGLSAQTLRGLAVGVLDAAGERPAPGAALLVPLTRRAAEAERRLAPVLRLEGGARSVAAGVRDLLDAGLDESAAEAALEALGQAPADWARERAEALVRCAAAVLAELERLGLAAPATVLRRAADLLAQDFERFLPSHAVLVHGFADATGAATELLQALLRHDGARLYLDRPPDPARPGRDDAGAAFLARFAERALPGSAERPPERRAEAAELELLRAPGQVAEAAAVARRLRAWIDEGHAPESLAVLVRRPASQLDALRAGLRRAGVPFSCGQAAGPPGATGRRVEALRRLLRAGDRAGLECWLGARSGLSGEELSDRLSALRVLGAPRLRDVAALGERLSRLADENGRVSLALRRGLAAVGGGDETEDEDLKAVAPHRKVPVSLLEREVERARATLEALANRPERADAAVHLEALRGLLTGALAWSTAREEDRALLGLIERAAGEWPEGLELDREDLEGLVDDALAGAGRHAAGGAGGGVQLLGVMEARGLTFERLVLAGLNRDSFPRVVREDPLLPDALRRVLNGGGTGVLPDLTEKGAGVDEERFLFAQALSAAPRVLLSWQASDEEGKPRPASPLLERLRLERLRDPESGRPAEPELEPHRSFPPAGGAAEERPAWEHALHAGLHGSRAALAAALPAALAESARELSLRADPAAAAAARARLLDEADAPPGSPARRRLGPWYGFVGPIRHAADPRREPLAVTRIEDVARCGWRSFLARVLRVEPAPDPLGALPALSRQLLGQVVHDVLEIAVKRALGDGRPDRFEAALAAGPVRVVLPPADELREAFRGSVERRAAEAGLPLGAFAEVVAGRAAELYETARGLDGGGAALEVLGAELAGVARVPLPGGGQRDVHFQADRVDLPAGAPAFVDYKTGRPPADQLDASKRRRDHLKDVRAGRYLQPSAYALAGGPGATGRFLFLAEGVKEHARVFEVSAEDEDFARSFAAVVGVVDAAWTGGAFLPRLDDGAGREPKPCGWCEVREACLRGDSGAKLRLREWAAEREESGRRPEGPAGAALDLFAIAARAEEASS